MARPERNNVDYFPFLCKEGKAMYFIEQKYGNDGYASWIKILRQLAVTSQHFLDLNNRVEFMFLSSKCKISESVLSELIHDLCELEEFNKDLWIKNKILFNEKFIESISDAYLNRKNKCITLDELLILLDEKGIRKLDKADGKSKGKLKKVTTEEATEYYRSFKHLNITLVKFEELKSFGYTKKQIDDMFDTIENYKKNTNYTNLFLTAKKWLEKEYPGVSKVEKCPYTADQLRQTDAQKASGMGVPEWFDKKWIHLLNN